MAFGFGWAAVGEWVIVIRWGWLWPTIYQTQNRKCAIVNGNTQTVELELELKLQRVDSFK